LQALREVNWVINVIDATYTVIPVAYTVTAFAGQNAATVKAACDSNLALALAPANYRLGELSPSVAGGEVVNPPVGGPSTRRQVVHLNDVVALLDRTLGVDYVESVTLNAVAADFVLPNPYSLPNLGTVTGTVHGATS